MHMYVCSIYVYYVDIVTWIWIAANPLDGYPAPINMAVHPIKNLFLDPISSTPLASQDLSITKINKTCLISKEFLK